MPLADPFLAVTDRRWFEHLSSLAGGAPLDEVNFWSPQSQRPIKGFAPGTPVFFRLKAPVNAVAGYGFFASFHLLGLQEAWDVFGEKNGDPDAPSFFARIGGYRRVDLLDPRAPFAAGTRP